MREALEVGRDLLPAMEAQKSYQAEKWTGIHRRCVMLEMAGYSPAQIAEVLGRSGTWVSIVLNDERSDVERHKFGSKIAERLQDVQLQISLHAPEALKEIIDEMRHSADEKVRQKAAFSILDRAGYGAVKKVDVSQTHSVPEKTIEGMGELLKELRASRSDEPMYAIPSGEIVVEEEQDDS